ncbi:MAG: hypothetical protein HC927_13795 [Deltaproteobacteria bacterium]|nr:hypothetical protein [Deltaproteobacteria bacterium]
MSIEYVDFETQDLHLLEFAADGSGVIGDWAPQKVDIPHYHVPAGLTVAGDGSVYFGIARTGAAATFWLHALDPQTGEITWIRDQPSFVDAGEDWALRDLAMSELAGEDPRLLVGGDLTRDEPEDAWAEAFVHQLATSGDPLCQTRYTPPGPR